ncbi:putative glutathione S transferase [Xylaria bambusicola]|uniref:putative glutathione S transferase n=1 Tax=Xylaria bambusicola TaxID=326684 RepID=UPI0020078A2F|nr:putative glutathione S transferase [Xylaria bambusicola]KAI0505460.1 putative glutathione S transferase [Xylaria bambusicola]
MANENSPEPSYTLYVYYTRYSSWGVRAQLILEYFNIPYKVQYFNYTIPALTPPHELTTLPVLDVSPAPGAIASSSEEESPLRIPDSLAIAEFLADQHPEKNLWPADPQLRALARVAAAQMHSGFAALRDAYPSNFVSRFTGPGIPFPEAVAKDVAKLLALWHRVRVASSKRLRELGETDQGFLCGGFSIADAFFWPVLWRLRSYNVPLAGSTDEARKWMATMWNHPVMKAQGKEYFRQARDSQSHFGVYDDLFKATSDVTSGTFSEDWVFDGDIA